MDIETWKSQLRKGAADLAILAMLDTGLHSGLSIVDGLANLPKIGLSAGSVYPLLSRLERDGRIAGTWEKPKNGGRSLKMYTLTQTGRTSLTEMKQEWQAFRDQLSQLVGETA